MTTDTREPRSEPLARAPRSREYLCTSEVFINATEGIHYGESPVYETSYTRLGDLFRSLQREYGRCVSKVYKDKRIDGEWVDGIPIGWVFEKEVEYEDSWRPRYDDYGKQLKPKKYTREVWVTVHVAQEEVIRQRHVMDISTGKEIG